MDNKKLLIPSIALLILLNIITLFNQRSMRKNFEEKINNLSSQIGMVSGQLSNQTSSINQSLNTFREESKWIGSSGYKILGYDSASGLISVEINWSFRELSQNSNVYLAYGEGSNNPKDVVNWKNVKAKAIDSLNYKAEVSLSSDKLYRLRVQAEGSSGSKGEEIMNMDMLGIIKTRFNIAPAMGYKMGPRYENHVYLLNNFAGGDFLRIKSAKAEIYVEGKLENTVELHRASEKDLSGDLHRSIDIGPNSEIWLNDDAVWIKGEENWVKNSNGTWNYKGDSPPKYSDIKVEITVVDGMGMSYRIPYPNIAVN